MWNCEFCGKENVYSLTALKAGRFPLRSPPGRDILYMDDNDDTDYENLDDMLIVLCVDISGSMSVTSEVPSFITDGQSCHYVFNTLYLIFCLH